MTARVLVVILNWRTAEMTLTAARGALAAMEGVAGGLTIVDNASGDGSFEALTAAALPRTRVIDAGRNGGFGAGNNVGIRAGLPDGRPDFVYLLNSDAVPAPDAIRTLRDHLLAHPATGFAGSSIHGPEGEPHITAFRFPTAAGEFEQAARLGPVSRLLRGRVIAMPMPTATGRVDWLAGASLMMRMDVLDRIGLFDERFFLYFEETELCLRAARAGWPTDYVVESRVAHLGGASTGSKGWRRIPGYWLDSRLWYFTKMHGRAYAAWATLARVAGGALWRLRAALQGRAPIDPPGMNRAMIAHAARHLWRPAGNGGAA